MDNGRIHIYAEIEFFYTYNTTGEYEVFFQHPVSYLFKINNPMVVETVLSPSLVCVAYRFYISLFHGKGNNVLNSL